MQRRVVNPWTWQDAYGFVQGNEVSGAGRVLFCAGQGSVGDDGAPLHPGDMPAQVLRSIDNLEAAGCRPASTLLGVSGLALPEMMVEIEATAVA